MSGKELTTNAALMPVMAEMIQDEIDFMSRFSIGGSRLQAPGDSGMA
jgi:hypothetical protein